MVATGEKILGLNGLRAMAVLLVFVDHKTPWRTVARTAEFGHIGVWIFFALSGFLIIGILNRERLQDESGESSLGDTLKRFFCRRALRIFPIYYLVLALCAVALAAAIALGNEAKASMFIGGWKGMLYHATYLSNILMGVHLRAFAGMMSHLWSLSVEEQFYIVFAPLLLAVAAKRHLQVCLACLVCGAATQFLLRAWQADPVFTYTFPVNNFAVMSAGGACYFLARRIKLGAAQSAALISLSLAILFAGMFRQSLFDAKIYPAMYGMLDVAEMLACAVTVMWIAVSQQSVFTRILEWRPIEYLGRISYGFYLYHNFIPEFAQSRHFISVSGLHPGSAPLKTAGFLTGLAASVLIAHISWRYLERPILKLKQHYEKPALSGSVSLSSQS